MSAEQIERLRELLTVMEANDVSTEEQDAALKWAVDTLAGIPVSHWHVELHNGDDDPFIGELVSALDYAADQLDSMADHQHDMISACGDAGHYEAAYKAFKLAGVWSGLVENLRNIVKQHTVPVAERAPLYAADDSAARQALTLATAHVIGSVLRTGPDGFRMWECFETGGCSV